jgi:hypothetical protein
MKIRGSDPFKPGRRILKFNSPQYGPLHILRQRRPADVLLERFGYAIFVLILTLVSVPLRSQQPQPAGNAAPGTSGPRSNAPSSAGGMATAGPQKAEFDSLHRPITAGGFVKDGPIIFQDVAAKAGLTNWHHKAGTPEKRLVLEAKGPGVCLLDYDNDGWKDLLIINGHVYPEVDRHPDWGTSYAQRPLLYHNVKKGKFELVPAVEGTGLSVVSVGRGAAFGDIFNDGKIDVVINNMDGAPILLRNVNPDHHLWIDLKLIGGPRSPRDAVGATVYLNAAGIRQRGDVLSGGSYLSSNDMRIHFGLGDAADAGIAEIHWPSGAKEIIKLPAVNQIYTISEGHGITSEPCCSSGNSK